MIEATLREKNYQMILFTESNLNYTSHSNMKFVVFVISLFLLVCWNLRSAQALLCYFGTIEYITNQTNTLEVVTCSDDEVCLLVNIEAIISQDQYSKLITFSYQSKAFLLIIAVNHIEGSNNLVL